MKSYFAMLCVLRIPEKTNIGDIVFLNISVIYSLIMMIVSLNIFVCSADLQYGEKWNENSFYDYSKF